LSKLYVLDTNICSYVMREHPVQVLERLEQEAGRGARICISVITYYEMLLGARRKPSLQPIIDAFVARTNDVLPWEPETARVAANLSRQLQAKGQPIGPNDTMIAAHALAMNATLVTNNLKEFRRVEGLTIEDWVSGVVIDASGQESTLL